MYSAADMEAGNPGSQPLPQQIGATGYIRHVGSVSSIDITANNVIPVDINDPVGIHHPHHHPQSHQQQPHSSFAGSPVSNQPIFTTLSFQNAQLQDYDPYARPVKRNGRATKPKRTPRPPNAFILYRKAKQAEVIRDNPGVSNKDVSCIIGQMWKAEEPMVQDKFREQAEIEKKKHKELHPNYKYQPRKPKSKRMQEAAAAQVAAQAAAAAAASGGGMLGVAGVPQDFGSVVSGGPQNPGLPPVLKDTPSGGNGGAFQPYSKYHLMMQGGGSQQSPQDPHSHPQTPTSQTHPHMSRADDYYYRGAAGAAMPGEPQQHHHAAGNGGFVGMPAQLDIKPAGFVNAAAAAAAAAYWTPATPSDAAFSSTLPTANVFHNTSSGDQGSHIRAFDASAAMPQHSSAGVFPPFDGAGSRQQQLPPPHQHAGQQQHMDYHQQQQQQQQQPPSQYQQHGHSHSASVGGGYGSQAMYHHSQHQSQQDALDGSSAGAADSQGLGLLSPPAVAWSSNI
ncbi:hypothetical protein GGI12_002247 [Dipsacomyces acuminosporus]|nr:hypothetical protein GGI12_002247 [Dipsacomyces acuminosporus]